MLTRTPLDGGAVGLTFTFFCFDVYPPLSLPALILSSAFLLSSKSAGVTCGFVVQEFQPELAQEKAAQALTQQPPPQTAPAPPLSYTSRVARLREAATKNAQQAIKSSLS
jgi:hypothetical protein